LPRSTLLPALLAYLGPGSNRLRIPIWVAASTRSKVMAESPTAAAEHLVQRRRGCAAMRRHPILLARRGRGARMRLGFPDAAMTIRDDDPREAYDLISEGFGPGANGRWLIAAELPAAG